MDIPTHVTLDGQDMGDLDCPALLTIGQIANLVWDIEGEHMSVCGRVDLVEVTMITASANPCGPRAYIGQAVTLVSVVTTESDI